MDTLKLNYKKTIFVGLAFFTITMFWQTYDSLIAKILIDKFGMNQGLSGVVMALDNMLALFLLPLFGLLSDKTKTRFGKRTPYIILGTVLAAVSFMLLSFIDHKQTLVMEEHGIIAEYNEMYESILTRDDVTRLEWEEVFSEIDDANLTARFHTAITKADGSLLAMDEKLDEFQHRDVSGVYDVYLSGKAWQITKNNPTNLIVFMVVLFVVLIGMSVYRTPAVALMPDVTLKPLRSKANAVINLLGSAGAIISILFMTVFQLDKKSFVNYTPAFIATGVLMLSALVVFLLRVNENKLVDTYNEDIVKFGLEEAEEVAGEKTELSRAKKVSLFLILTSVFLWFMGYNAVISKLSDYAPKVLHMGYGIPLLVAQGAAIVSFIPIGILSSRFGRKKMILIGVTLLTICFGSAFFLTPNTGSILYLILALTGVAWATINVNSFPMAVELAKGSDVGKYTGYYYTFSMAAQIITPIISGFLMDAPSLGKTILFPYAALFVALSFVTMFFVKHGDVKVERRGLLESFDVED